MADEINVLSRTQIIFVEPTSGSVSVINAGPVGVTGPEGPPGSGGGGGVPTGGTTGQVLTKDTSTDYDTSWQTPVGSFPIIYNDGTYTYTISVTLSGVLTLKVTDNSTGTETSTINLNSIAFGGSFSELKAHAPSHDAWIAPYAVDSISPSYIEIATESGIIRFHIGTASPVGVVTAPKGSLFVNVTTASLYMNTNNATAWSLVGGTPITLPLTPTQVGPGTPEDYAVYTKTGWSNPPSPLHVWSGSGWILISGASFGLTPSVSDVITPGSFAATESVVVVAPVIDIPLTPSDTFTPGEFAATDSATVTLT